MRHAFSGSRRVALRGGAASALTIALLIAGTAAAQSGPVIEDVEPTSGPPGTLVHVTGRRFAANAAVSIGGQTLQTESRLPNRISVRVPAGAPSGAIAVSGSNGTVRGPEFRVTPPAPAPVIDGIEPASGRPGAKVTIRGKHFSPRLAANVVALGGRPAVVLSATPQKLEIRVPEGASTGPITVDVQPGGEAQSASFTVTASTAIEGFSPDRAVPGSELTIRGQGFATDPARNRVFLGNVRLAIQKASEQQLVVALPAKIASGELLVDVLGGGRAVTPAPVEVQLLPTVLSFSPASGKPGTLVSVRGTNFTTNASAIEAKLGDSAMRVRSAAPTALELEVPAGATSDRLSIRVFGVGPAWSDQAFTVIAPAPAKKGAAAQPLAPKPAAQ